MPKISIIIVSFNTSSLLGACLGSLFAAGGGSDWEIIVVDNASSDESVAMVKRQFAGVKVIVNSENLGFARANNIGINVARAPYILLLNSDTEVPTGTIEEMIKVLDANSEVGAATCKVVMPSGKIDPACHRGFPTPWAAFTYFLGLERLFPQTLLFGQYHQGYKDINTAHEIDCPVGAFFLVRRKTIDKVGLLDENFFMYGEDVDWAYRIKLSGWKILFYPGVSIFHRKKQSGRLHEDSALRKQTQKYFYETMKQFYHKHYTKKYPAIISWLVDAIVALRIAML